MSRRFKQAFPHLAELGKHHLKVAKLVNDAYPHWMSYAQAVEFRGDRFLKVAVPAPYEPGERDLSISSYDYDLTLFFAEYHAHFGRSPRLTIKEAFELAKRTFIEPVINEEAVVVAWISKKQVWPLATWTPLENLSRIDPERVYSVRSWNGTYSRIYNEIPDEVLNEMNRVSRKNGFDTDWFKHYRRT